MNLWMTHSSLGLLALGLFVLAYILVMTEEMHQLRKSKPVVLAAGIIWALVAIAAKSKGLDAQIAPEINHSLLEYSNLFLFLLVAMTYVNALEERKVFEALKGWMLKKRVFLSYFILDDRFYRVFYLRPCIHRTTCRGTGNTVQPQLVGGQKISPTILPAMNRQTSLLRLSTH